MKSPPSPDHTFANQVGYNSYPWQVKNSANDNYYSLLDSKKRVGNEESWVVKCLRFRWFWTILQPPTFLFMYVPRLVCFKKTSKYFLLLIITKNVPFPLKKNHKNFHMEKIIISDASNPEVLSYNKFVMN